MTLKKFLMVGFAAAVLVACGDDDSDFATRPSGDSSSSSVILSGDSHEESSESKSSSSKNGDARTESGMTSSSAKYSSSATSSSSSSAKSSSSSKVKSSSSEKETDSSSSMMSSSSHSVDSSSSSVMSSSSSDCLSSSSAQSSSSSVASSSGVPEGYVDPLTVVKGTMTDERDGQTYKTVKIGTQTWMAENLNYAYIGVPYNHDGHTSDSISWCFDNKAFNCTKYGRLYTWAAAMDSVGTWSMNGKGCGEGLTCSPTYPVRGVCPEGWHLPTQTEWNTLFTAVGGQSTVSEMLKSTSGWSSSGNGTDSYAFSALPAGCRRYNGYFYREGNYAYFWSSTEGSFDRYAINIRLHAVELEYSLSGGSDNKYLGSSVRCVKD